MDGERGELRRLPAAVVVDDLQERRAVAAAPSSARSRAARTCRSRRRSARRPSRSGAASLTPIAAPPFQPSEPPPLANMVPGSRPRHVIGDRRVVGDALVEDDGVLADLPAHAGGQVFRRDGVAVARSRGAASSAARTAMALGIVAAAFLGRPLRVERRARRDGRSSGGAPSSRRPGTMPCAPMYQSGIDCFSGSTSMWKIAASSRGRLTVGIHGTSLSMTRTTSASASASFWNGWFQWLPW